MEKIIAIIILISLAYLAVTNQKPNNDNQGSTDYENIPGDNEEMEEYKPDRLLTKYEIMRLPEMELLIRTVYGEGRSENVEEIKRIIWVIRNRKNNAWFPNTYKQVVLDPEDFSCWNSLYQENPNNPAFLEDNEKAVRRQELVNQYQRRRIKNLINQVLSQPKSANPLPGVYNYLEPNRTNTVIQDNQVISSSAGWAEGKQVAWSGKHVFLRS